ncbi:MAG: TetR/AcrR family transcriptional regulator [Pseudomonadota bacterium]
MSGRRRSRALEGQPKKADVTRQQILTAAAQLFSEKGYEGTTLRDVAERVSLRPASVYYHFDSKERILDEVLDAGVAHIKRDVEQALAEASPSDGFRARFHAAVRAHLRVMLGRRKEASDYIRVYAKLPPSAKVRGRRRRREYAQVWADLLADAQAAGDIAPEIELNLYVPLLLGGMNRATEWYGPTLGGVEELARLVTRLFLDGARNPPAAQ